MVVTGKDFWKLLNQYGFNQLNLINIKDAKQLNNNRVLFSTLFIICAYLQGIDCNDGDMGSDLEFVKSDYYDKILAFMNSSIMKKLNHQSNNHPLPIRTTCFKMFKHLLQHDYDLDSDFGNKDLKWSVDKKTLTYKSHVSMQDKPQTTYDSAKDYGISADFDLPTSMGGKSLPSPQKYLGKDFIELFKEINGGYIDFKHLHLFNRSYFNNNQNLYTMIVAFLMFNYGFFKCDGKINALIHQKPLLRLADFNVKRPDTKDRKFCYWFLRMEYTNIMTLD